MCDTEADEAGRPHELLMVVAGEVTALVLTLLGALTSTGVPDGFAVVFLARAVGDFRYVGFFKRVRGTRFARLDTILSRRSRSASRSGRVAAAYGGAS